MIHDLLHSLGFSDKETKVYTALIRMGRATPADLARKTKCNRATVYAIAKSLIGRGVITQDFGRKKTELVALTADHLVHTLARDRRALEEKERAVHQVVSELSQLAQATLHGPPKIRFVDEAHMRDYLYAHAPLWNESALAQDKTWWGFQDKTLTEQHQKWIDWLWRECHKEAYVRLLTNDSASERRLKGRYAQRQVKFLKESQFTATTWVMGEYVVMVMTKEQPSYLIDIHDAMLAGNIRQIFVELWKRVP